MANKQANSYDNIAKKNDRFSYFQNETCLEIAKRPKSMRDR